MIFPALYFTDPNVTRVGDMGDFTYLPPYGSAQSAKRALREESERLTYLNGTWDFRYYPCALDVNEHFYRTDFNTRDFDKLPVPSVWQLHGYEPPVYLTSPYPIPFDPPSVPYANPMGAYVKHFDLDKKQNKRYTLTLEGVSGAYYLWLNGSFVGYAETSHGAHTFDVTDKVTNGDNRLAVAVLKWSSATYIEDQDMFRHNGIFRDVYLAERDESYLLELLLAPTLNHERSEGTLTLSPTFFGEKQPLSLTLSAPDGTCIYKGGDTEIRVPVPMLWSAETPHLYTLSLACGSEYFSLRFGFRTVETKGRQLLINGTPVKLRGVNRHDVSPTGGFVVTREEIRNDLLLMKEFNIDSIRTAHYPPTPYLLELADELGFYVMCEADMESHGCQYHDNFHYIADDTRYRHAIVERGTKMVRQNRNFTSIILWSLGNESSFGDNIRAEGEAIKALDPRPIHYQGLIHFVSKELSTDEERRAYLASTLDVVDVISVFYPAPDADYSFYENDPRPILLGEYCHAMGNSCGDIHDHWVRMRAEKFLAGGMIWEWCDHGIKEGDRMLYGGDHEKSGHGHEFCMDGLVSSDRVPHTALFEVKMAHAPVRVEGLDVAGGRFALRNDRAFTDTSDLTVTYRVEELGTVRDAGTLSLDVPPQSKAAFTLPLAPGAFSARTYVIFSIKAGERELWQGEFPLPVKEHYPTLSPATTPVTLTDENGIITVKTSTVTYRINKYKGMLAGITVGEKELMTSTATPALCRVPISNDRLLEPYWFSVAARKPLPKTDYKTPVLFANFKGAKQEGASASVSFDFSIASTGRPPYFAGKITYTALSNGKLTITENGTMISTLPALPPRYGHLLTLDSSLEELCWYGCGKRESYVDKHHAEVHGIYRDTVTARTNMDSEKPMEHGSIYDNDFLAVTDKEGCGVIFAAEGFSFNASHYDFYDMLTKDYAHRADLPVAKDTFLLLDRYMMGIGSASVGKPLSPCYAPKGGDYRFTMSMLPVAAGDDPVARATALMTPRGKKNTAFPDDKLPLTIDLKTAANSDDLI